MHKTGAHRMTAASSAAAFVTEAPDKSWIIEQTCLSGTAMPSPITSVGKRGGTGAMRWCPAGICPGDPGQPGNRATSTNALCFCHDDINIQHMILS